NGELSLNRSPVPTPELSLAFAARPAPAASDARSSSAAPLPFLDRPRATRGDSSSPCCVRRVVAAALIGRPAPGPPPHVDRLAKRSAVRSSSLRSWPAPEIHQRQARRLGARMARHL